MFADQNTKLPVFVNYAQFKSFCQRSLMCHFTHFRYLVFVYRRALCLSRHRIIITAGFQLLYDIVGFLMF